MVIEKVLVIDDEPIVRRSLQIHLRSHKLTVAVAATVAEAESLLAREAFDLMFVDVRLPDGNGTELLSRLAPTSDRPLMVIMTGHGTLESAVSCIRAGAFDYIIKPFSMSQIDVILKKAESFTQAIKVSQVLLQQAASDTPFIGESMAVRQLRQIIQKVAPTEATVLISGDNGTGKELVATEIFRAGGRSHMPFIKVNCAAISETLIESEFFGHEKGAFTGASEKREGRFELANHGTILLDEISEISLKVQAKLLRVLQEREFERVGGNRTLRVNVRVLATTNRDLQRSVERQEFRQDLYYRLNVFPVLVPSLRQRKGDVSLLAVAFLRRLARRHGVVPQTISLAALQLLEDYGWPGNVRELQNVIERAVILTEPGQEISPDDLAPMFPADLLEGQKELPGLTAALSDRLRFPEKIMSLEQLESEYIQHALKRANGNRTHTAHSLGISIRTLRNKLNHRDHSEESGAPHRP
ncbi:MAG TPA: sigma-54 dependent transcriptional regulator [Chthoniobacterales bacterium]